MEDNIEQHTALQPASASTGPGKASATDRATITESEVTIKQPVGKRTPATVNPKLSVFREFVLATLHACAEDHSVQQSCRTGETGGEDRQFFACDLIAQSGIAGLQWKRHLGQDVHVTVVEQRDPQSLQDNIADNSFSSLDLPLDPKHPAGTPLASQSKDEIHVARCDPAVMLQLEAFDFLYLDPHRNPAPFFNSLFRNVRNNGMVCLVVPDTMHFARSPHIVRRCYGADCMKTEYLKELAVRIILAAMATEAAKCNKGVRVLYAVCVEDFLLLCLRVARGPKVADTVSQNIGHVLHCRICEDRVFYPDTRAPVEDPYSMLQCDCRKNVPGKTAVILGPVWKGSLFDYPCLSRLAASGRAVRLSAAFFSLLQRVMEDCLCDSPPSLHSLQQGVSPSAPHHHTPSTTSQSHPAQCCHRKTKDDAGGVDGTHSGIGQGDDGMEATQTLGGQGDAGMEATQTVGGQGSSVSDLPQERGDVSSVESATGDNSSEDYRKSLSPSLGHKQRTEAGEGRGDSGGGSVGVKRPAAETDLEDASLVNKRLKASSEPAPCFYYNIHSKRMAKNYLPKHHTIIECLRAHGYRCCRTHFEKYAVRTNAGLHTLTGLLGTGENKVLYVKGCQGGTDTDTGLQ